ncbi:hypothetical protein GCM10007301_01470 [Azorhizobium oxalatiphilum]|uniref:DUF2849 domain-containing protein n=1 Tax=Azorhizobium oxalatiphilum TaxID=980631 RepID=A0A917BI57_9HYPH|nr:DUF2849 domain-containing protein [Azorhizobium oxalatiphilum]GGF45674.1 hypothetical protein GCM10007301_01470 [Azorhizobium oxalatiphilum]
MTSPLQQKLKITGPTVITANRLTDGVVVWLTAESGWSDTLSRAAVVSTPDDALRLLGIANADENHAVGAYPARVTVADDGSLAPVNLRERIRVGGPTVALPGAAA